MSEPVEPPFDRRHWLLSDGQMSLAALQRSVSSGGQATGEAALHVMDLSSLLAAFGLRTQSQYLKDLAQGLSEDPHAATDQVQVVLPRLTTLLEALKSGQADLLKLASEALLGDSLASAGLIEAVDSPTVNKHAAAPAPNLNPPAEAVKPVGSAMGQWSDPVPFFSAGLVTKSYASLDSQGQAADRPEMWAGQVLTELRSKVLQIVQDAALSSDSSISTLTKLNAVQDALVKIGQWPVRHALAHVQASDEVWLDQPVLELLEHLTVFSQRASRVTIQLRNLTAFVWWQGATLTHAEIEHVGQKVGDLWGRIELLDAGVQLILPVSLQRMRMVSYRSNGQWHAVSQAQFLGWQQGMSSPQLKLRVGCRDLVIGADEPDRVTNMNLHPWPTILPAPSSLQFIGLDADGRLYLVHRYPL